MDLERYVADRETLAARLRDLRQAAGMTGVQAAARTGMSQPKISKLENGRLLPSVQDVELLLDLYRAGREERSALVELAARLHATMESNRTILRRGAARQQAQIGEVEADATILRYFSPGGIAGLLQTAEYMRRVFAIELTGTELVRTVTARQQRQQALYVPGKQFTFVLTEACLRWRFCPDEVMAAQAAHIASLSTLSNIQIGVIPLTARPGDIPLHGYEIFDDRLVTIGLEHATVTVTDPRDIAAYLRLFEVMSNAAEFGEQARARLGTIARDFQP